MQVKNLLAKFGPSDVIALFTIFSGTVLILDGKDGVIGAIMMTVTAFYFGKKVPLQQTVKKEPEKKQPPATPGC